MTVGPIDVGHLTPAVPAPVPEGESTGSPTGTSSSPKVNGTHPDSHLSVGERLARRRRQRDKGQQEPETDVQKQPAGVQGSAVRGLAVDPLDLTLDLIHELTHNQRQYRPDRDSGGVGLTIVHLPTVVRTALERIQARVPVRCGKAPIIAALIDWGLKGLGQYPAVQRMLWLRECFRERAERGPEQGLGGPIGRGGKSLYGIRGQVLQTMFEGFEFGFAGKLEKAQLPFDTHADLKEVTKDRLGLDLQDGAIIAMMYTLVDVAGCESTRDVTVEDDRQEMRDTLDQFLNHVQVRSEAAECVMRRWGMLA